LISDAPDLGTTGIRSNLDQSDMVCASSLLCRNIADFPTFRCNFKNMNHLLSREGGCAVSSLDMEGISPRSGEDACILAVHSEPSGETLDEMASALSEYRHDPNWTDRYSTKKRVIYNNTSSDLNLGILDLGIRAGLMRFLRERCSVTLIPPSSAKDVYNGEFDLAMVSNGPGTVPGPSLLNAVREFLGQCGPVPLLAMGIGALAANIVLGGTPEKMGLPHRSASQVVKVGDIWLPTYQ